MATTDTTVTDYRDLRPRRTERRAVPRRDDELALHVAREGLILAALAASEGLGAIPGYPSLDRLHEAAEFYRMAEAAHLAVLRGGS